jgi:L-ascorbate metabolism protein UlaG (beta-lactamase superfamily)
MTFQEAADLAGELRAGTVLPGHWDMFEGNLGDPDAFADYADAKYPGQMKVIRPEILRPVEIRAGKE